MAILEQDNEVCTNVSHRIHGHDSFRLGWTCADAESPVAALLNFEPDMVRMDINLPRMDRVECIRRLKTKSPDTGSGVGKTVHPVPDGSDGEALEPVTRTRRINFAKDEHDEN